MRVNVYAEELLPTADTDGTDMKIVELIQKQVVEGLSQPHRAIQILVGRRFVHSSNQAGDDDDTSAVKFWYYSERERQLLVDIFAKALEELRKPEAKGEG